MKYYLLSVKHPPPFFFFCRWFEREVEFQVVAWKFLWFIEFNILIIKLICDLWLVIHLVLFDFKFKLFEVR